jgi:hypothetical protein
MAKANKFKAAIVKLSEEKEYNASNKKKIQKLILLANDARVVDTLTENNVDPARFNARALYATEKCVKVVYEVTRDVLSVADLEKNTFAVIKSALNAMEHDEHLTKADIESAILADAKVAKDREHIVFQRQNKISATAQVQQCIDVIKTLGIAQEVARNVFQIKDTPLTQMFKDRFAQVTV